MVTKQKNLHRRWSMKETVKKVSRRQRFQRMRESTRNYVENKEEKE